MKKQIKNLRHGDTSYTLVEKLPEGLELSKTKVVLQAGSGGHTHTVSGGKLYLKSEGENIIGYLVAGKNTKLGHEEHGSPKIPKGVYQIRRQVEFFPDGIKRQVVD